MTFWQDAFSLDPDLHYLNHAAVAPWPDCTRQAVVDFAAENASRGAADYPRWQAVEQRLRDHFGRLINCRSDDIALLKNTSEGLSLVAYGLDFSPGDEIVGIADDFPSNRILWQSLAAKGVSFRGQQLDPADPEPEQTLLAAVTDKTRLLAVSSVHYATGLRLDLKRLGAFCRANGILFCVDAIQSLGVVPFDVQAIGADFVAADGHKWLLGPEGLALFYCRPELRERLRLHQYGWHMMAEPTDFDANNWLPAASARRFECGSPNMLGVHALATSLELILSTGVERIENRLAGLLDHLFEISDGVDEMQPVTPRQRSRRAGIFSLRLPGRDPDRLWRALMARGVICASRGGLIRFSPHAHSQPGQLDSAVQILLELLATAEPS